MFLITCKKCGCFFTMKKEYIKDEPGIVCPNCQTNIKMGLATSVKAFFSTEEFSIQVIPDDATIEVRFDQR